MKLTLWLISETEKARQLSTTPNDPHRDGRKVWIPRSVVTSFRKWPKQKPEDYNECELEIEDWFAEREDL